MISLKINNLKNFTSHLLVKDTFAQFLLVEGQINTHSSFTINGRINEHYYTQEDWEHMQSEGLSLDFTQWGQLRPVCYEIIKGKNLPTSFKFILKLNSTQVLSILTELTDYNIQDIGGFFLNIKYDADALTIVTGTSLNTFTLDKTPDKVFDNYVTQFLEKHSIDYTIC